MIKVETCNGEGDGFDYWQSGESYAHFEEIDIHNISVSLKRIADSFEKMFEDKEKREKRFSENMDLLHDDIKGNMNDAKYPR